MSPKWMRGKLPPYGRLVSGLMEEGAGGAVASADIVGAHNKEAVGVDGFSGADKIFPPAGLAILIPAFADAGNFGVEAGGVLRAGQGMEQEDGIIFFFIELTVGFIRQGHRTQRFPGSQYERVVREKLGFDVFHKI